MTLIDRINKSFSRFYFLFHKTDRFFSSLIEYYRPDRDAAWSIRMMSPAKILIPATALALVAQLTVAFADGVPRYNLEPLCRGIAQQGGMSLLPNQSPKKDYRSCIASEASSRPTTTRTSCWRPST